MKINLQKSIELIRQGRVIAIPTDTVYGLACDMHNEAAILELYTMKQRSLNKPLVIQVAHPSQLDPFLRSIPIGYEKLVKRFWPGSLTLILPIKTDLVPYSIRSGLSTAGFRIPNHTSVLQLLEKTAPLVVSSANQAGMRPALTPEEIEHAFGKDFPILDDSLPISGHESTILAYLDAHWMILRKGDLLVEEFIALLGYRPSCVRHIDTEKGTFSVCSQLYLSHKAHTGDIKVVLGFEDRKYPQAETFISMGSLQIPDKNLSHFKQALITIENEGYPYIWVDMNFSKEGVLKSLAQKIEMAAR